MGYGSTFDLACFDSYSRISFSNGFLTSTRILEEEHFFKPYPSTFSLCTRFSFRNFS